MSTTWEGRYIRAFLTTIGAKNLVTVFQSAGISSGARLLELNNILALKRVVGSSFDNEVAYKILKHIKDLGSDFGLLSAVMAEEVCDTSRLDRSDPTS